MQKLLNRKPATAARLYGALSLWAKKVLPGSLRRPLLSGLERRLLPCGTAVEPVNSTEFPEIERTLLAQGEELVPLLDFAGAEALPEPFHAVRRCRAVELLRIPHGAVCSGGIATANDTFLEDAGPAALLQGMRRRGGIVRSLKPQSIDVDVVALNNTHIDNYFHWFHDVAAPLLLLPDYKERLYCAPLRYRWQKTVLELIGIRAEQIIPLHPGDFLRFTTVSVVTAPEQGHPALIRSLARIPELVPASATQWPKRIFVSRDDAQGRRALMNEDLLMRTLEPYGFRKMVLSRLPVAEQIACLRGLEAMVLPQGAAVVNMAFCPPQTRVLELYAPRFPVTLGVDFSTVRGMTYRAVMGEDANTSRQDAVSGFMISPEATEEKLKELLSA